MKAFRKEKKTGDFLNFPRQGEGLVKRAAHGHRAMAGKKHGPALAQSFHHALRQIPRSGWGMLGHRDLRPEKKEALVVEDGKGGKG